MQTYWLWFHPTTARCSISYPCVPNLNSTGVFRQAQACEEVRICLNLNISSFSWLQHKLPSYNHYCLVILGSCRCKRESRIPECVLSCSIFRIFSQVGITSWSAPFRSVQGRSDVIFWLDPITISSWRLPKKAGRCDGDNTKRKLVPTL